MRKQPTKNKTQNIWQIQEAKAKFSHLVECAVDDGCQTITKNGEPVVVLLSIDDYNNLIEPKQTLVDFFKSSPCQEIELDIPKRQIEHFRKVDL